MEKELNSNTTKVTEMSASIGNLDTVKEIILQN